MNGNDIDKRFKQKWDEATKANGGDPNLPKDVAWALREEHRLEWVEYVAWRDGKTKPKPKGHEDGQQKAEGTQEADPGEAEAVEEPSASAAPRSQQQAHHPVPR